MIAATPNDAATVQFYARSAGILGLTSIVAGGFGEAYVPAVLVTPGDAAATAAKIAQSETLFRWGFAAYLVEALCDTALTVLFYLLLRIVRHDLALLAVFFRLIGTAGFAMAQVFFFAALPLTQGSDLLSSFPTDQRNALAMLSLSTNSYGHTVFGMFFGAGFVLLGHLIWRAGFLPRFVGILLAISGLGFIAKTFTWALAPAYSSPLLLLPTGVAVLVLTGWLLIKGVDTAKWSEQAARRVSS